MECCGEHMDFNIKVCLVCVYHHLPHLLRGVMKGFPNSSKQNPYHRGGSTTCSTLYLENLYRSTKQQTQ